MSTVFSIKLSNEIFWIWCRVRAHSEQEARRTAVEKYGTDYQIYDDVELVDDAPSLLSLGDVELVDAGGEESYCSPRVLRAHAGTAGLDDPNRRC